MIGLLLKAVLFYFIFIFVKSMIKAYSLSSATNRAEKVNPGQYTHNKRRSNKGQHRGADIEAEYRVVKD